ncbi:hypothetical protein [Sphingobium sp. AP50]|uniref:hypothetical protein n=1 Tax=Sphingobium sp. AP50 TaxID=1884369 RepID=UPI0011609561|nr:hypothetical protein [Sphingobium sp. AP50]
MTGVDLAKCSANLSERLRELTAQYRAMQPVQRNLQIQPMLGKMGYYTGPVDGLWGRLPQYALNAFFLRNGYPPAGEHMGGVMSGW